MTESEKDECVSCGQETPYFKHDHLDARSHYVECAGQLCEDCWSKVYDEE